MIRILIRTREREYREKSPRIASNLRDDRLLVWGEKMDPRGNQAAKADCLRNLLNRQP